MRSDRVVRLSLWAVVAAFGASCVDGGDPTAIGVPRTVQLTAAPVFSVVSSTSASAAEVGALTRARVTVREAGTLTALGTVQQDVDPSADQWTLEITLEFSSSELPSVVLEAELASVDAVGAESVEWSGRTNSFQLTTAAGPTVREVAMYRGPLDNLDVTGVTVTIQNSTLLEGESAWISAEVQGGGDGTRVYYEALDPAVATVSATGKVTTHQPGTARVVAVVGAVSDTVTVNVEEVVLPEPQVIDEAVSPQVDYTAVEVVNTLGDPAGAQAIASALNSLGAALSSGQGGASVAAFEEARAAWESYGDPTLRILDGPQLSLIEITLIHAADALGIDFG